MTQRWRRLRILSQGDVALAILEIREMAKRVNMSSGATAALAAPFQPKSAELLSIISSFETAYSAYNAHQAQMERFWTLRYLQQASISTLEATVIKAWPDQPVLVRADALPLVLTVTTSLNFTRT